MKYADAAGKLAGYRCQITDIRKKMLAVSCPQIGVALCAAFVGGCQIAQGVAEKAPFAKPPVIVQVGARKWDGDSDYYSRGGAFEVVVKHGLTNELLLAENGDALTRVSSPPPLSATPSPAYMLVEDVANDVNAQTTTQRFRVFTRESLASGAFTPPADGTVRTYSLTERSINPRATGKDLLSDPTDVRVTIWGREPVIAVFTTSPANPATNVPLTINWRVNDAKYVELRERVSAVTSGGLEERESVIERAVFNPGAAGSLEGTRTLNVTPATTALVLRAFGAGGSMVSDYQEVNVSGPVPCPENANGRKEWFTFCLECTGRPPEKLSEPACTEAEAQARLDKFYKSEFCEVKNRACFAP